MILGVAGTMAGLVTTSVGFVLTVIGFVLTTIEFVFATVGFVLTTIGFVLVTVGFVLTTAAEILAWRVLTSDSSTEYKIPPSVSSMEINSSSLTVWGANKGCLSPLRTYVGRMALSIRSILIILGFNSGDVVVFNDVYLFQ